MILKVIAISLVMMSSAVNAYDILVVAPLPYRSHWVFMERIIYRLMDRGYGVTVISPFKYRDESYKSDLLEEIIVPKYNVESIMPPKDFFIGRFDSDISYIQAKYKIGLAVSEHTLNNPNVKNLILDKEKKFDVVVVDSEHQDSLYMFSHKFNCPLVTVDVNGLNNHLDEAMGILTPHSFVPHSVTKYENEMTYMQRCYNALLYIYETAVRRFSYMPAQNKLAQKHFHGEMPHVQDVVNKISVVLSNTYRMSQKQPKMASQVDVGGAHIRDVRELPADLNEIVSNSQNGVVYFSLGTYLKPSEMPKEKLDEIIKAFGKTKKTILWQFDGDVPPGLPDNVIMQKWFPQNDLLGHKKVILFITQGGTLSFQEGLVNRVPMLIIPFTGEQYRNALQAERGHFGKMLLFDDVNEDTLETKMNEIMRDDTYFTEITKVSARITNSPTEPLKEAVFWIHHVAKYKSIEKSPSVNYSWFTYYSIDVVGFYAGILLTCILFWVLTIKLIVRRYREREQKGKFKYY